MQNRSYLVRSLWNLWLGSSIDGEVAVVMIRPSIHKSSIVCCLNISHLNMVPTKYSLKCFSIFAFCYVFLAPIYSHKVLELSSPRKLLVRLLLLHASVLLTFLQGTPNPIPGSTPLRVYFSFGVVTGRSLLVIL